LASNLAPEPLAPEPLPARPGLGYNIPKGTLAGQFIMTKKLTLAILLLLTMPCFAGSLAITGFSGGGAAAFVIDIGNTIGWEFNLPSPVTVTSFGVYNNTGLSVNHDVGIWDASGTLIADTTVLPTDPLLSGYLWHSVSPAVLGAGTYYIGAYFTGTDDFYYFDTDSVATDPAVTFIGATYSQGSSLSFPNQTTAVVNGRFGPNFQFDPAVPEPGSLALTLCGAVLGGIFLRRRRA
jgi:hypothetical protein